MTDDQIRDERIRLEILKLLVPTASLFNIEKLELIPIAKAYCEFVKELPSNASKRDNSLKKNPSGKQDTLT